MILKKELQQLAAALKATKEYSDMSGLRKKIMGSPGLGRQMISFEREHLRLLNLELPDKDMMERLNRLYAEHENFLQKQDVKDYIKAAQSYHSMIAENIGYLNSLLDITGR